MNLVFNELSVMPEFIGMKMTDISSRKTIDGFVSLLHDMQQRNLLDEIISSSDIHAFYVTEGYGVNEWLSDDNVSRTHKQFFQIIRNKRWRYIESGDYDDCEFKVMDDSKIHNAIGCLIASKNDCPVISIETNIFWTRPEIKGEYISIDEDGDIYSEERVVRNFSGSMDISTIEAEARSAIYQRVASGQDLWELRNELYPDLIFCRSIKEQLYKDPEKFHVENIMKKLKGLQEYFASYNGVYNPQELGMGARTESETVKTDPFLKNMRKFRKPNGEEGYFFDHLSFSGKFSGRIHFLPQNDERKCYVGYIGKHLPTKKY